ncbi:BTAD domain-containing putative transcriptional regulator [Actinoplanes sp. NPDC051851]|uniref:AfsR/SARP family transcriptional regulator n=1 Tax=Actinoplanes sp. NPDC051851 TaxID=3154753 RepID=UPI00342F7B40
MSAPVRYRILGPIEVEVGGRPVAVTAGRDRIVLVMLLLNPGRVVGASALIEAMWEVDPPATARGQLQTCVSRLRRVLPPGAILSDPAGYRMNPAPDELDALAFGELTGAGGRTAYRKALDLWRGPVCAEIDAPAVRQAAAALDERYALAVEEWADLELAAGRERELIGELGGLVERFPLRERLRGQLMTALVRAGRRADALAEFRRARQVLIEELGIEPGPELQELHREALAGRSAPLAGPTAVVRCLPRTVADFTGRAGLVARLAAGITAAGPAGPVVVVVDGMAGGGKTTLALHLAALVGEEYPDAHLFIDLQGHSEHEPVDPSAALLILLRQLGLSAEAIPDDLVDRIGLWRTELARRRVLVVLDNAASSAQVADLLPTAPGGLALITSRRRLAGLDGVQPESLPILDPDEALALLERIAGPRVRAEPVAAAEVVRRCGGLPLAVRLAGARLAHRPRWRVAELLERLGEAALPELAVENRSVASAFALSYEQLGEPARRLFRLLGVYPGVVFDGLVAAVLTGLPLSGAQDLLDELLDGHLIEEPEPGVFRLHDLLREFAAGLADELPADEARRVALEVLNFEVHAAALSSTPIYRNGLTPDLAPVPASRPDLLDAIDDPGARVERQRPSLLAFTDLAISSGQARFTWFLARAVWYLLFYRGYGGDIDALHGRALAAAEEAGDRNGIAMTANYLASVHFRKADYRRAREILQKAIRIWEDQREFGRLAAALGNLAAIHEATGRFQDTVETIQRSLRMLPLTRRVLHTPSQLNYLSTSLSRLGRYRESLAVDRRRLMAAVEHRDVHQIANALLFIQSTKRKAGLGTPESAERYLAVALFLTRSGGFVALESDVHSALAGLRAEQGRFDEAIAEHRIAIEIVDRLGDRRFQAEFRHDYATTMLRSGEAGAARELFEQSLLIARRAGLDFSIARALAGIAECVAETDPDQARELWTEAYRRFEAMGTPERFEVADRLAAS